MKTDRIIKGSITHVLNYIVMELMRYGFKLAIATELADLREFVNTDADKWMRGHEDDLICLDDDLVLLEEVDDAAVKQLLTAIERILKTGNTYLMMGSLDPEEVLTDQDIYEESEGIFSAYSFEIEDDGTYDGILGSSHMFFCSVDMLLFYCITQLELNKLDVYTQTEQLSYNYYCTRGFEFEPRQPGAVLLMDLRMELITDANILDELAHRLKGEDNGE